MYWPLSALRQLPSQHLPDLTPIHILVTLQIENSLRNESLPPSNGKVSVYNVRDLGLIPGLGTFPGEGNGDPLQYSCLGKPMDRGPWQATVHGFAKESDKT